MDTTEPGHDGGCGLAPGSGRPERGRRWVLALAAVLLGAFVGIAWAASSGSVLTGWDERVTSAFVAWRTPGWSRVFWVFTLLGDAPILAALATSVVLTLVAWGRRARASMVAGALALVWGILYLAKESRQRTRPQAAIALIREPGSHSLPSGHALVVLVFCGLLVLLVFGWIDSRRGSAIGCGTRGRRGSREGRALSVGAKSAVVAMAATVTVLVGISRVYLGVHWVSDVLAGWCLGGAWLAVVATVFAARERVGASWGLLSDSSPRSRRTLRVALIVALVLLVAAVIVATAWADPLLG